MGGFKYPLVAWDKVVHLLRCVDWGSGGLCISIKLCWVNGFGGLETKSLAFGSYCYQIQGGWGGMEH